MEAERYKVYFSSQLNVTDNTESTNLTVTVCSFDEWHHCMAVTLLNRKEPIVEEVIIPPLTISNDGFTQQLKQLEDNFCVLIKEQKLQDISISSKQIMITGFCPSRVKNAHSSIVSFLKLYSEHHVKLECKPEEVIYLCKVDKESETILSSLPAKLSIKGAEITVTGNYDCIAQSKESIFNGLLLHLQFKSYTYECRHTGIFISLTKDYLLEPFADENKIQYYIEKQENNGRNDGDVSSDPKIEGFQIIIYSRHEHVFSKVCCEMEVLTPKTILFQLYCEEAMHFARKDLKVFEEKYRVRVILDDRTCELTIHGLTLDEIQQCWKQIDDEVQLNVETTKKIPLKTYEFVYLQKKQMTKLKRSFSCEITFPQHRESKRILFALKAKLKM